MVARDCWSNPWDLGHGSEWTGTACRPCSPSEPAPRHPGPLVDPAGTRSLAEVARDIWFTPRGFGRGPKSPGRRGRPHVPSAWVRVARDIWSTPRPRARSESPGTVGGHCRPSGTGLRRPGRLFEPAGPPTRSRVSWDNWSTTRALWNGPQYPGTPGRNRRPSEPGRSRPGLLVDPAGPQARARVPLKSGRPRWQRTRARFARDSWSTRDPAPETEMPGRVGRHCGPSGTGLSRPEQVVDPAGSRTQARVAGTAG